MKSNDQNTDSLRNRRHFSPQEKVRLLRLHLVEDQSISSICEQHQLHPTLFYQWQKTFFENGAAAFEQSSKRRPVDAEAQKIERLEARLKRKDEVIALVTEELVRTKKELGEG
ncbi:transposase [Phragmitibacter flavus]|uniref:Transposase n=1 Tax=Phragmitibacter flavus TaxID=2576071 RepID=A0A5R8KGC0_9BACT|nr:transposase [Phragmitibacter flavus]TLD71357.1 transposase [Phragmitibacter flavus]